jgi:hypothetical protein
VILKLVFTLIMSFNLYPDSFLINYNFENDNILCKTISIHAKKSQKLTKFKYNEIWRKLVNNLNLMIMENYFSDDVCSINYKDEKKCLFHYWKPKTGEAAWEEIKAAFIKYVEYIEHFSPGKILVDETEMHYIFVPEEQEWIEKNMMPRVLAIHTEKTAIVKSQDIFVEMATDMMMKQDSASKIQSRFFGSVKETEDWLFG